VLRLKKKHSRILAFLIVFLAILGAIVLGAKRAKIAAMPSIELLKNKDGSIDAAVVFGAFQKSEVKDGKKIWEITAKVGKFHTTTGVAELQDTDVSLLKEADTITIHAAQALITLTGNDLKKIEARGDVVIHSQEKNTTIYTDSLLYDRATDRLTTPDPVRVVSPDIELQGSGLEGNTALKQFSLARDVKTIFQATGSKKK